MNTIFSLASTVALSLVHSLWELALLALLAAASLAALRQSSAMWRHAVGMGWLLAMLAAPLLTFVLCWQEPVSAAGSALIAALPAAAGARGQAPGGGLPWTDGLLVAVSLLWLAGVLLMGVRQAVGWRLVQRLRLQAFAELPPVWQQRVDALRGAMGITRTVSVRLMGGVVSPFTAHVLRPLIWLPATLLTQLPREQIEALLAHELAHIRRLDWCWNALQCVAETLFFFHPGLWWLNRRVRQEREHACDDLAVAACGDAVVLAEALASLQAPAHGLFHLGLAAHGGSLLSRITHLLSGAPARAGWRAPGALLLLLACSGLLAMEVEPAQRLLVNLRVDSSSRGALTPGNHRDFSASYLGAPPRHYRIEMDLQGHVTETYTEGGRSRPIDAPVRQWLQAMAAMDEPAEPTPPSPPSPPAPPPSPPPLPAVAPSAEFQALMAMIGSDPRVVALTGAPAAAETGSFHGSVHSWGVPDFHLWGLDDPVGGKAAFSVNFSGPKGRATVTYVGKTERGVWKAKTLNVVPARS